MRVKYDKNMVRGYQVVAKRHFLPFFGLFFAFFEYDILSVREALYALDLVVAVVAK